MSLALVQSRALLGLRAVPVAVEAHLANGLPSFTLVGLADVEVKESRAWEIKSCPNLPCRAGLKKWRRNPVQNGSFQMGSNDRKK